MRFVRIMICPRALGQFLLVVIMLTVSGRSLAEEQARDEAPAPESESGEAADATSLGLGMLPPGSQALPRRAELPDPGEGLRVVVGPSARRREPVAIPEALCAEGAGDACREVISVLRNNMYLSGYFDVLPAKTYIADMSKESLTNTSWADWINVGATYLIKAEVKGDDPHDLAFRFYNVVEKQAYEVARQDREGVARGSLRRVVHEFSNGVMEVISGTAGVFDTQILYSVVTGLQTKAIGVMDMDGHGARILHGGSSINMLPSWAPDGNVLYTSFRTGVPSIWLGNKRLARDHHQYRRARFSPCGTVLAVSVDRGSQSDIWLMSPEGEMLENLTNSWADEVSPTWSPDGSKIAFVSSRAGGPQIYVMNRDGSDQRRLTMAGGYNSTPEWGVGDKILFAGMDDGHSDIFTVDLEGNIVRLTQDQGNNRDPAWAPNGRHVTFTSNRDGPYQLWIMTECGRWQFKVSDQSQVSAPSWLR